MPHAGLKQTVGTTGQIGGGGTGLTGLIYWSDWPLPVLPTLHISVEHLVEVRTDVWH